MKTLVGVLKTWPSSRDMTWHGMSTTIMRREPYYDHVRMQSHVHKTGHTTVSFVNPYQIVVELDLEF